MSEEFIKNLLGNINYEVETDTNWVEPLGFGRDTWKALLKYIQQKENIIKEVREYIDSHYLLPNDKGLLEILDKENNMKENLGEIRNILENILYVLERIEKKLYSEDKENDN